MPKSYADWIKHLSEPSLPAILGIGGEERAFVDEALIEIKNRVLAGGMPEFNFDTVSAKSNPMTALLATAKALPIMSPLRLVIVTEADTIKADDFEIFDAYAKNPNPTTVLVFVFEQLDTRVKFQKSLDGAGRLYKFDHPRDREMLGLIKSRGLNHGLRIGDDAASLLLMEIGSNLLMLERALEKLALACEPGAVVGAALVEAQIAQTAFRDAFTLARAVVLRDKALAAKMLAELKSAQEVPLRLVGVLAWQCRVVLKTRLYLDEKVRPADIASRLSLFGDRLEMVMKAARAMDTKAQVARLVTLSELDRALKSSRVPAWLIFDRAVLEMC
ncbi:MAG: DNA polymerase III subunit delta [Myxococcota bacterium]